MLVNNLCWNLGELDVTINYQFRLDERYENDETLLKLNRKNFKSIGWGKFNIFGDGINVLNLWANFLNTIETMSESFFIEFENNLKGISEVEKWSNWPGICEQFKVIFRN